MNIIDNIFLFIAVSQIFIVKTYDLIKNNIIAVIENDT